MDPSIDLLNPSNEHLNEPENVRRMVSIFHDSYPQCDVELEHLFEALKESRTASSSTTRLLERQLENARVDVLWCVLSSHCPTEANQYVECAIPKFPVMDRSRPALLLNRTAPVECRKFWRAFDQCLINHTNEFEKNQQNKN